jgi:hypothetical protein
LGISRGGVITERGKHRHPPRAGAPVGAWEAHMNRRLAAGILAGAAAVALGVLGAVRATYSEPVGSAQVPDNAVGVAVLQLDLDGGADAELDLTGLMPGQTHGQRFWLAASDPLSSVGGTLTIRFSDLVDTPAACSFSRGKALAEIESGIAGCTVSGEHVTGTPAQGNLSRLIAVQVGYGGTARNAADCGSGDGERSLLADDGPGDLRRLSQDAYQLVDGGAPMVLSPGEGVCVAVTAAWPPDVNQGHADPEHPTDNAAQGDSLKLRARFQLTQVTT